MYHVADQDSFWGAGVGSHSCRDTYLLVGLDNLDDLIVNLPPEQLLGLTAVVYWVEEHQLHTKLPQSETHTQKEKTDTQVHTCSWLTGLTSRPTSGRSFQKGTGKAGRVRKTSRVCPFFFTITQDNNRQIDQ